tara:strand:+ start:59 stop:1549 length:1491 start_codon:yes stop_codon:yes gene_type:complete
MSKKNFFIKYLKNINKIINNLLEKNLNKLNSKNLSFLYKNNKIILTFVALFVIFVTYLLLPTLYNQKDISKKLKNEILNKFDLKFEFSQKIKYNFLPRPHFTTIDSKIFDREKELSKIGKIKIFISLENLFSFENIEVRDLIFENANFNINKKNYNFFLELLNKNFENGSLILKNSNIFYKNPENEVLFINKILKMKYYFDTKELKNIFYSDNEIFNIPFSLKTFYSEDKNKIFSYINLNLMKLKIKNQLNIKGEKLIGQSEFVFNKDKRIAEYRIENKLFKFYMFDKLEKPNKKFRGNFNLKPFYASLNGELDEINLNFLFGYNDFIVQLLKTEILNHKNIEFKLNLIADRVYNNSNFRKININSKIQDGLIDTDVTKFTWKDFADFELLETLIYVKDGELVLDGKLNIKINDHKKVYTFLLTPKNYRTKIKQINLNFTYNFDKKIAQLKDIKIDNKFNENVNKILMDVILKKNNFQNKIYFKNLLNEALKSYAG